MQKKIGILTVYSADYSSFFHAVSLCRFINELGYDAELINESHRYKKSYRLWISHHFYNKFPYITKLIGTKITLLNTYSILKNELKKEKVGYKKQNIFDSYDCIIIGGDELWSATNSTIRFIPEYFGIGLPCPHISYSTSGITLKNPSYKMRCKIIEGLKTFSSISVRDKITAQWVQNYIEMQAMPPVVLDPTLLNPFFVSEGCIISSYILVYGEHFSPSQICFIKQYAVQHNKTVKSIAWKHRWCDIHISVNSAMELQGCFANSAYVMSSTFHGTIFAILHNRQFTAFTSEIRGKKVEFLLEDLQLMDRLFIEEKMISPDNIIDYTKIKQILHQKRQYSINYLMQALDNLF